EVCVLHKRIAIDLIFQSPPLQQIEFKGGFILERLFQALLEHTLERNPRPLRILPKPFADWIAPLHGDKAKVRLICDYLSGLTDGQAVRAYRRLFEPDFGSIAELY